MSRTLARSRAATRAMLHPIVPAHYRHPVRLARQVLASRQPAAWFAAASALSTMLLAPLDIALQPLEQRRRERSPRPNLPVVLVCGPPRSGTTMMTQLLIRALTLSYITNLMAVFPRSPVTASHLAGVHPDPRVVDLANYYGRTSGLRRPNDALPIWDRWLGSDRTRVPATLVDSAHLDMKGFFGAVEAAYGRPVISKNNGLNTCAHLIAEALPSARFICLDRDPVYLAQSLLRARREIHGTDASAYGLHGGDRHDDPVADVAAQVRWHSALADDQERRIGGDRFLRVSYDELCVDPRRVVADITRRVFGAGRELGWDPPILRASRTVTLADDEFADLERRVAGELA